MFTYRISKVILGLRSVTMRAKMCFDLFDQLSCSQGLLVIDDSVFVVN